MTVISTTLPNSKVQ